MTFLASLRARDPKTIWNLLLLLAFLPGAGSWVFVMLLFPDGLGSHANNYTAAAAAWLNGIDPWTVGPPEAVYAGPPPMLIPYLPFIPFPEPVTRLAWFAIDVVAGVWAVRRLGLPALWIAFPPLFGAIFLGHPEVLILALIVLRGPIAGLAVPIKPYAAFPLLADRRWAALGVAAAALVVTLPFLPWSTFIADLPAISATLARQSHGDSVFGNALLMVIAAVALASLGIRRALWLAVPVLWPAAQPIYKTMTLPMLTPLIAVAWALPVPGATLVGVVSQAALEVVRRRRRLPAWVQYGLDPIVPSFGTDAARQGRAAGLAASAA